MLPLDDIVVEEGEEEVEDDAAPDSDVVPDCPVRGIQSNLSCNHNDEDSSHDRTKEIVISQDQTIIICLVMVSSHWNHEEHHGGDEPLQGRDAELPVVEKEGLVARVIQVRILMSESWCDILVKKCHRQHGQRCVKEVVDCYKPSFQQSLGREPAEECIPEVAQCEGKVFVEKISEKFAHSIIRPSTMHQQ